MAIVLVSLLLGVLVAFYFYVTHKYKYWQKRGIPCADGFYPGVGHMWMLLSKTMGQLCCKVYNDHKKHSMVGIYNFMSPTLLVREPELVKTVLQTNFTSFHENASEIDHKLDPLLSHNPFFCYGEKWMTARKRLTYAFSSMRLKTLLESVKPVCVLLENFVDNKIDKSGGVVELELKELFSRYTAQVVASAAYGIDGFCFDEEKEDASFRNIGNALLGPTFRNKLVTSIIFIMPSLNKLFRLSAVPKHIDKFFRTLVTDLMEQRRTDKVPRNDFLHLMVQMEQMENDKFDVETLAAHTLSFFLDGYETSSITLGFVTFHLASNPKVQERLREEVVSVLNKYDGVMTYEALKDMTYMDQVISESQRLIHAVGVQMKKCTEEFELKGSDGLTCRVQPGTEILIPVQSLHDDPQYWENPDVFDPDRFSPDRKHNIQKFTFIPFGEGPRMCVGMRMALLQIKVCLATLLRKYNLELSPKTQLPLKMIVGSILTLVEGGVWIKFRKI